jgi:hypothetical protein
VAPPDDDSDWICPAHEEPAARASWMPTTDTLMLSSHEDGPPLIELFSASKGAKVSNRRWASSNDSAAANRYNPSFFLQFVSSTLFFIRFQFGAHAGHFAGCSASICSGKIHRSMTLRVVFLPSAPPFQRVFPMLVLMILCD